MPWQVGFGSSALFALRTISIIFYVEYVIYTRTQRIFLKSFFYILAIHLLITDIYIFINYSNITTEEAGRIFVIGNKFIVSYYHLIFAALFLSWYRPNKFVTLCLALFCIIISKFVHCSTGIIGATLFLLLTIFRSILKKILYSPVIFCGSMTICILFAYLVETITNNIYFIALLSFFEKSSTITGRSQIYSYVFGLIEQSFWFGYGNGNATTLTLNTTNIGNAQNGVVEDILNWGIIGFISFLSIPMYLISSKNQKTHNYYILCIMYLYIFMGTLEITLGTKFLVIIALFLLLSNYHQKHFFNNNKLLLSNSDTKKEYY